MKADIKTIKASVYSKNKASLVSKNLSTDV